MKPTRFLLSSSAILDHIRSSQASSGTIKLKPRAPASAIYPSQLCEKILRGAEEQRMFDHGSAPPKVQQGLVQGDGLYALELVNKGDAASPVESVHKRRDIGFVANQ